MLKDLKEFSFNHYTLAIAGIAGLVSPGLLIVMQFKPELLITLDIFKLLLVCITLSFPTAILAFVLVNSVEEFNGNKPWQTPEVMWIATMLINLVGTSLIVYNAYLNHKPFSRVAYFIIEASIPILIVAQIGSWCRRKKP